MDLDFERKIFNKLLKTIDTLEVEGVSRPVAEKQAFIKAAEFLQKTGMPVMKSILIVEKAMKEIKGI